MFVPSEDGGEGQRTWLPSLSLCGVLQCVARSTHVCSFEYIIFSPHTAFIHHNLLLNVCHAAQKSRRHFFPPLVGDLFADAGLRLSVKFPGSLRALAADAINAGRIFEYLAADNGPQMRRVKTNLCCSNKILHAFAAHCVRPPSIISTEEKDIFYS